MNYLYNGVELPALPEWDKAAYPYAVIATQGRDEWGRCFLYFAEEPFTTAPSGGIGNANSGATLTAQFRYVVGNDVWDEGPHTSIGCYPIWSNFDLYYPDNYQSNPGGLCLAASTPVPVYDPTALLQGYLVGCRIRAMRGKKKIVGYSYNGTVLPGLPEWNKEKYPYAWIGKEASPSFLYMLSQPPLWNGTELVASADCNCLWYSLTGGVWVYDLTATHSAGDTVGDDAMWTNTDILNTEGAVHLAASDPAPIYE